MWVREKVLEWVFLKYLPHAGQAIVVLVAVVSVEQAIIVLGINFKHGVNFKL